ncbi:AtpZ/AtpI family protein [Lutibacter sp.]|uniref:AtpZ/AtpI family protein n=1 Tax=Lutibacter sp. TaxID=1925666 RepID=UPI003564445C
MNNQNKKKQLNKYLQLTGITFQMGITIFLGAYFGKKLDAHFLTEKKTFTIILTLVALIISIWSVLAQLKNINEKND